PAPLRPCGDNTKSRGEPGLPGAVSRHVFVRTDQHAGNTMIEISHLSKRYGPLTAVDDISFNVEPGEVLGFLGPNGAGKSTTMKLITGFLAPTNGSIRVCRPDVA